MKLKEAGSKNLNVTNNSPKKIINIQMYYNSVGLPPKDPKPTKDINPGEKEIPCPRLGSISKALISNDETLEMVKSPAPGGGGLYQFEIKIQRGADTISVVAVESDGR